VFLLGVFIDFLWFSSVFLSNKQSGHSGHLGHLGPSGAIWAIWGHPGPPGLREKCAERYGFYDGWRRFLKNPICLHGSHAVDDTVFTTLREVFFQWSIFQIFEVVEYIDFYDSFERKCTT